MPKPRNVTATQDERGALLEAAAPNLRCWLLLCSDLAIRAGTAARLGPANYNRATGKLSFRTKFSNTQELPVTAELAALIESCDDYGRPFVAQLPRGHHPKTGKPLPPIGRMTLRGLHIAFRRLKQKVGITRRVTAHDLRRTTVRRVYDATLDLRLAQSLLGHTSLRSTLWYLQGESVPVPASTLELAKLPPTTGTIQ